MHIDYFLKPVSLLGGLLGHAEVWGQGSELTEYLLCFVVLNSRVDDNIITLLPVGGCGYLLCAELKGVNHTNELNKVASSAGRVNDNQTDLLCRINDVNTTNSKRESSHVVKMSLIQHSVEDGYFPVLVSNDGVANSHVVDFVDILNPLIVVINRVNADGSNFNVALLELILLFGKLTQLGGAHRCEISGMAEEDPPRGAQPVVEFDVTLGGVCLKIRCCVSDSDGHLCLGVANLNEQKRSRKEMPEVG